MSDEPEEQLPAADGFDDSLARISSFAASSKVKNGSFTNEGTWVNGDEEVISPDREVVVVNTRPGAAKMG